MSTSPRTPNLDEIVKAIEIAGGPAALARRLRVTTQAVCFWRDGKRKLPEVLGASVEAATGGQVTRQSLWPDTWRAIWPELASGEGAAQSLEAAHG